MKGGFTSRDLKAAKELQRVVRRGGQLLFVVPVAENPILFFNAQRIYSYGLVLEMFSEMRLVEFAVIPDARNGAKLVRNGSHKDILGQRYACGCFHFTN